MGSSHGSYWEMLPMMTGSPDNGGYPRVSFLIFKAWGRCNQGQGGLAYERPLLEHRHRQNRPYTYPSYNQSQY